MEAYKAMRKQIQDVIDSGPPELRIKIETARATYVESARIDPVPCMLGMSMALDLAEKFGALSGKE